MEEIMKEPVFFYAVAFAFFIVLALLKIRAPALAWMDAEITKIREELDKARSLRAEAEAMLASYRAKEAEALAEAEAIIRNAQAAAERLKIQAKKDLADTLVRQEQQVAERIRLLEAEAREDIRRAVISEAMAIARTTLSAPMEASSANALTDKGIESLAATAKSGAKAA